MHEEETSASSTPDYKKLYWEHRKLEAIFGFASRIKHIRKNILASDRLKYSV